MNTDDIIHPEISAAERQVREDQERLARSLDRLTGSVDSQAAQLNDKKTEVFQKLEDVFGRVQGKLDEGVGRIEQLISQGEQALNEKFAQADEFVGQVGNDFGSTISRTREIFGRVKSTADGAIDQADQTAARIEGVISNVRQNFLQSADELLGRVEGLAGVFRENMTRGTGSISQVLDRAEDVVNRYSDPRQIIEKNPRLGVSTLFFAGIVIGVFFRQLMAARGASSRSLTDAAPVDAAPTATPVGDNVTAMPTGIIHSDRRAA